MELKELTTKTLELFNIKDTDELGEQLKKACMKNDFEKFEKFLELIESDLSIDWMQKIFQYYEADRKSKMQDYTPKSLAILTAKLAGDHEEVIDMCGGSGALTIQKWASSQNKEQEFEIYEFDENVIPYLLFNLVIRNIKSTIYQADVLQDEIFKTYKIKKGDKYGILEEVES